MKWQQTFTTPWPRVRDGALPAMILGAVFIHGMAFYLIQPSTPTPSNREALEARISLLDPEKDRALLAWIENHDPAAVALQTDPPPPKSLFAERPYQPSYQKVLPEPLPISTETNQVARQSLFPPGPVPEPELGNREPSQSYPTPATRLSASASVDLSGSTGFVPPQIDGDIPKPARFFLTRSALTGETFYFLLESSGIDSLDEYCRRWLTGQNISLKNAESSGWLQVFWGTDVWKKKTP